MTNRTLASVALEKTNHEVSRAKSALTTILPELLTVDNSTLPLVVFEEHFLSFFSYYIQGTAVDSKDDPNVLSRKWLELANGGFGKVDIIGDDGSTVFTVPGLYNTPKLDSESLSKLGINFHEMARTYYLKKARLPEDAENYLGGKLANASNHIGPDTDELSTWLAIFARYDMVRTRTVKDVDRSDTLAEYEY